MKASQYRGFVQTLRTPPGYGPGLKLNQIGHESPDPPKFSLSSKFVVYSMCVPSVIGFLYYRLAVNTYHKAIVGQWPIVRL